MTFTSDLRGARRQVLQLNRETLRLIESEEQRQLLEIDARELERRDRVHLQTAGAI